MNLSPKKRFRKFGLLGYFQYLKSPEVAMTAAVIAGALVFYAHLQARRLSASPFTSARLESPESALLALARGSGSSGSGPAGEPGGDSAKAMAEYGQSSVRYVDGRAEPPEGGRVFYDDVGKGAGQTIKGVLRLADARKLPEGVDFWENEFKEALQSRAADAAAAGDLPTAAKAQDVLAPVGKGAYSASASAEAPSQSEPFSAPAQAQGGEPPAGGAPAADPGAPHVQPADDPLALVAKEMPEGTSMLASAQAASSFQAAGELMGRLSAFSQASGGVKSVDQPITLPLKVLNKKAIYQLTTTEVYGLNAKQNSDESEFETSTEETGLVFDGKQPNCQNCNNKAMAGPGGAPSVGGGALNSDLLEQAQQTSNQVVNCSAIGQEWQKLDQDVQESLAKLDTARVDLLTAVADCRDKNHEAYQKRQALAGCRCDASALKTVCKKYPYSEPNCGCRYSCKCDSQEREWRTAKSAAAKCQETIPESAKQLVSQCKDFNKKAEDKMRLMGDSQRCGSMPYEKSVIFNCPKLIEQVQEKAAECYVPGTGAVCGKIPPR